jgi:hypothetical protein
MHMRMNTHAIQAIVLANGRSISHFRPTNINLVCLPVIPHRQLDPSKQISRKLDAFSGMLIVSKMEISQSCAMTEQTLTDSQTSMALDMVPALLRGS